MKLTIFIWNIRISSESRWKVGKAPLVLIPDELTIIIMLAHRTGEGDIK